ncbi:MAG: YgiQ family radical SAM protein, partial [Bacteroidales bacterium]|nr:YgiQ family radical SAM protein [Bacteroidales bacterium]
MEFPTSKKELERLDWDYVDVILITGDAFIDHPSFGTAIIARVLEQCDLRVAVLAQPNWRDDLRDFKKLGIPRLFFGISSGSMDSMVNHYTATKRLRSNDAYTPGGTAGQRPDYATTVYSRIVKDLYPHIPVVLGGVEASLRRFSHYDYWSNTVKPSILVDSKADIVVYGMGEKAIVEIAKTLRNGGSIADVRKISQIGYISYLAEFPDNALVLPSHEECVKSKKAYAQAFCAMESEINKCEPRPIVQACNSSEDNTHAPNSFVVINPPFALPTTQELDDVYALPYTRMPHSRYAKKPEIPAFNMIQNSVTIHRGCFGACSFCSIAAHQGKRIASRSEQSIMKELQIIRSMPYFKGHISDLGGPSANMYAMGGRNESVCRQCTRVSCLFPQKCKNLNDSHKALLQLYKKSLAVEGIKR